MRFVDPDLNGSLTDQARGNREPLETIPDGMDR